MNKKRTLIIVLVFCLSILAILGFCNNFGKESINHEYPMEGYGLQLYKSNGGQNTDKIINKNEKDEFDYIVKFVNNTDYDNTFLLSIYLNYQQVEFNMGNQNNLINYRFSLKRREEKDIPVHFLLKDAFYKTNDIIISVMTGMDKYTSDLKKTSNLYGISSRFSFINPNYTKDLPQTVIWENTKLFLSKEHFEGIIVTNDFNIKDKIMLPPLSKIAKPGEQMKFAVRAGGVNDVNNYMGWLTLNGKQIEFNKGNKYWYFSSSEGKLAYDEIFFNAPDTPGKYEICAYLSLNPFSDKALDIKEIYSSYRFTLIVE